MKKNVPTLNIVEAAIDVFQKKGYKGSRMSDIAKELGIEKKELKSFYSKKELIFKDVFLELYGRITPQLDDILNGDMPVFEKIRHFTNNYVNFINDYKFLPLGLMRKLNFDTDLTKVFIENMVMPNPNYFYEQVEHEIEMGNIRPINPKLILINIFALSVFPHVASPLMKDFILANNDEFEGIKEKNKTYVADFIINSIKIIK